MRARVVLVAILSIGLLASPVVASAAGGSTERISVAADGSQADSSSNGASISGDGRYVAFTSNASDVVSGDSNGTDDVFVRDRETGTTERVSVRSDGVQAVQGASQGPAISADGRYVAFTSRATNLVPGDTNGEPDIFVHDRTTGETERVSISGSGAQASSASSAPKISADGRYVAFDSSAANLVTADTNGRGDVFVHDRGTGSTERVSIGADGSQGDQLSYRSSISADGNLVAFTSYATNLVPGDVNGFSDVYVRDRAAGTTEQVSIDANGTESDGSSSGAAISADGRYVAFSSWAADLVPSDTNDTGDVFVHDRVSGATERVSLSENGAQGDDDSAVAAISADGRFVGFRSFATNLLPDNANNEPDVFVRDRSTGTIERVSTGPDGAESDGYSDVPDFSDDGRYVAFQSIGGNLVPDDTNMDWDVFVHDREGGATGDITPPELALPAQVFVEATTPDGAVVTFSTTATDDTDPNPTVECAPASGEVFPIGKTTVACTAVDVAGNQSSGEFAVNVAGATEQLASMTVTITGYSLKASTEKTLVKDLEGVQDKLNDGKIPPACGKLGGFTGKVGGFEASGKVTPPQADELTEDATRVEDVIGC